MNNTQLYYFISSVIVIIIVVFIVFIKYYPNYKPGYQLSAHHAKILVLSCMDFRLIDDLALKLALKGELNNYDQFILAGASLGYNINNSWASVFEEHIKLAKKLHNITHIYIIDHLNCGMYKNKYSVDYNNDNSIKLHTENLKKSVAKLNKHFPNEFKYKTFIMRLDGSIINVNN